jgi:hypothetical protein
MVNKNSKSRRSNKKKKNSVGGKPILRNVSQQALNSMQSITNLFNNIQNINLQSDPARSLYGFFFKVNLNPSEDIYRNINTVIQDRRVNNFGYKITIISNPGNQEYKLWQDEYISPMKGTSSISEFKNEVKVQYAVFSNSYRLGANNLTPSVIHSHILNNANAIAHLRALLPHTIPDPPRNTNKVINNVITCLQRNPTWRLGGIFMELFDDPRNIFEVMNESTPARRNELADMMRWALLKSALVSGYLHADYHLGNCLYARSGGFFSDLNQQNQQVIPVSEKIQLIDWGRSFQDLRIAQDVRTLFNEMVGFARSTPNFPTLPDNDPRYAQFNARINNIFIDWSRPRHDVHRFDLRTSQYTWVYSEPINSKTILMYEMRHRINRLVVHEQQPGLFANTILAPDQQIVNSIALLV